MSRVVITNNFSPQDFQPSHSTTPLKRKKPQPLVSSPRSRALSISRHVKAAIEYTTSQDLYLQKSQAILSLESSPKPLVPERVATRFPNRLVNRLEESCVGTDLRRFLSFQEKGRALAGSSYQTVKAEAGKSLRIILRRVNHC